MKVFLTGSSLDRQLCMNVFLTGRSRPMMPSGYVSDASMPIAASLWWRSEMARYNGRWAATVPDK